MNSPASRAPAIFFGHGNPMEALGGRYADAWRSLGQTLPRPRAVLMVSAHWFIDDTAVTAAPAPRTLRDFAGFPQALFDVEYPAPGSPWLVDRVVDRLAPQPVRKAQDWGLDHGSWSVLRHVFPDADVPVVQLSLQRRPGPDFHFALGRRLRALREEGVLIAGSGNVTHNLRAARWDAGAPAYDWAVRFSARIRDAIASGNRRLPIDYQELGRDAELSVPTPEHYLPLLCVLGAAYDEEPVQFFTDEIDMGSVSMLGVALGLVPH